MKTGDKELWIVGAALVVLVILLWLSSLRGTAQPTPGGSNVYFGGSNPWGGNQNPWTWTVPGFPDPGNNTLIPAPININVNQSGFGGLEPYFPLFGFVGVDTTRVFQ